MTSEELVSAMLGATVGMIVVLLLCLYGCADDTDLRGACGEPCKTQRKGLCSQGTVSCTPDGVKLGCVGPEPTEEICDGLDQDCDGFTDNGIRVSLNREFDQPTVCGPQEGVCNLGMVYCRSGALTCQPSPLYGEDTCDGQDNDCDGETDEGPVEDVCDYPFDPETLLHGNCRRGVSACIAGRVQCVNQQGPEDERCDGQDTDCNGLVDDVPGMTYDVIIAIERSGSFEMDHRNVQGALDLMTETENIRYAVVRTDVQGAGPVVLQEFDTLAETKDTIRAMSGGTSWEEPLPAMAGAVAGTLPVGAKRPGAVQVTLNFSDEPPQPSGHPALCPEGVVVHSTPYHFGSDSLGPWGSYVHPCGGEVFELGSALDIHTDMTNILRGGLC